MHLASVARLASTDDGVAPPERRGKAGAEEVRPHPALPATMKRGGVAALALGVTLSVVAHCGGGGHVRPRKSGAMAVPLAASQRGSRTPSNLPAPTKHGDIAGAASVVISPLLPSRRQ